MSLTLRTHLAGTAERLAMQAAYVAALQRELAEHGPPPGARSAADPLSAFVAFPSMRRDEIPSIRVWIERQPALAAAHLFTDDQAILCALSMAPLTDELAELAERCTSDDSDALRQYLRAAEAEFVRRRIAAPMRPRRTPLQ